VRSIRDLLNISTRREKNRGNLWAAVQARRILEFNYHGGHCIVEPFALGITRYGDPDNESLICYQTTGPPGTNVSEGWRTYRTSEIRNLKVAAAQFAGDRPGYNLNRIDMVKVFCCVRPPRPPPVKAVKTRAPPEVKPPPAPDVAKAISTRAPPETRQPPVVTSPRPPNLGPLSHNELMRQFRLCHTVSSPLPAAGSPSSPPLKPPQERPESKNKPLTPLIK
jgi:hypothetical protein